MAEPSLNYWVMVEMTLKAMADPTDTLTVRLSSKEQPRYSSSALSTSGEWPIITSVSDLGGQAGQYIVQDVGGSLTIDNTIGSIGYNRKFSDLLQRYTCINQAVTIKIAQNPLNVTEASSLATVFTGKIESWSSACDLAASSLTFNVIANLIPDRVLNYVTANSNSVFADAPEASLGKYLPLCFGDYTYVPGYRITADQSATCTWVAWTNFKDTFATTLNRVYLQDEDDYWVLTSFAGATTEPAFGSADSSYAMDSVAERAFEFYDYDTTDDNDAILGFQLRMYGNGNTSTTAELKVSIYKVNEDEDKIGDLMVSGTIKMADYAASNTSTNEFTVQAYFERPLVTNYARTNYAIAVSGGNYTAGDASWANENNYTGRMWTRDATAGDDAFALVSSSSHRPMFRLVRMGNPNDNASSASRDSEGRQVVTVQATVLSSIGDYDKWDYLTPIFEVYGLTDDGSGTITGTPGDPLVRPDHVLNAMEREWNGSAFAATGNWDFSTLSSQYTTAYASSGVRTRRVHGNSEGRITLYDLVEGICRDTASRVGITNAGKLFLWPWGPNYTKVATIPPEDIVPLSWDVADVTSVINRVTLNYAKTAVDLRLEAAVQKRQQSNYSKQLDWSSTTNTLTTLLAANSKTLYGVRALESFETDYIASDTSAETLAEFLMATGAHPASLATFLVPYHRYSSLKMFDVIEFSHPEFPCFHGATGEDGEPVEEGSSAARANLKQGHTWYRAEPYRGLIEGRFIRFPVDEAPAIRLIVRVLSNFPADPT